MKKLTMMAILVIAAITANAQRGYDNNRNDNQRYGERRTDDYNRNGRYENNHGSDHRKGDYGRNNRFDPYGNIDSYQREARKRIAWGIETGAITAQESRRLLREVERIEDKENRYLRDRSLSKWERKDLADDLADLNRMISREKRDSDRINHDDYGRNRRN